MKAWTAAMTSSPKRSGEAGLISVSRSISRMNCSSGDAQASGAEDECTPGYAGANVVQVALEDLLPVHRKQHSDGTSTRDAEMHASVACSARAAR